MQTIQRITTAILITTLVCFYYANERSALQSRMADSLDQTWLIVTLRRAVPPNPHL
jgi:hypothetical protein